MIRKVRRGMNRVLADGIAREMTGEVHSKPDTMGSDRRVTKATPLPKRKVW